MEEEKRNIRKSITKPAKWTLDCVYYNREHKRRKVIFFSTDINKTSRMDASFLFMAQTTRKLGHDVVVVTTNCEQTIEKNELKYITVYKIGEMIPKFIWAKLYLLFYILRTLYLTFWFLKKKKELDPAFVVVAQPNFVIPLLKRFGKVHVVQLQTFGEKDLVSAHSGDPKAKGTWFQRFCIQYVDEIIVQNKMSRVVFINLFPDENKRSAVLYPCVDTTAFEKCPLIKISDIIRVPENAIIFVAFGPYRRSSNFELIIKAFARMLDQSIVTDPNLYLNIYLVIAGYNEDPKEYFQYSTEIESTALKLCYKIPAVLFVNEASMMYRKTLLDRCVAVLHPMINSLDGHTILEANLMKKPVIACNSGIAIELIEERVNGFLLRPEPLAFVDCMNALIFNKQTASERQKNIYTHFKKRYNMLKYSCDLQNIIVRNSRHLDYSENSIMHKILKM